MKLPTLFKAALLGLAVLGVTAAVGIAQQEEERPRLDVPYVPTRTAVVEKMLEMGEVGPEDFVIDLGSGDGRILVAAARRGARGFGVDIDPQRIAEANANAKAAGVADRISFRRQDLFQTPIAQASVLTMYLLPEVNLRLRPRVLDELKPGTRVVSHAFSMGEWMEDEVVEVDGATVYLWIVPAKVDGRWTLTDSSGRRMPVTIRQTFQQIDGMIGNGSSGTRLETPHLRGDLIRFTAGSGTARRVYEGRVVGDRIEPVAKPSTSNATPARGWRMTRAG